MPALLDSLALFHLGHREEGASAEAQQAALLVSGLALRQWRQRGATQATDLTVEDLCDALAAEHDRVGRFPLAPDRFLLLGALICWHVVGHPLPSGDV